ncbi:alpha-N-acetylgalactosaminidase-like [Patiria miniata]|uniref:Alpha-galactosidase n=1 Tax=Patiria miniata TaxID=46514 RepID=A0A913ZXC3_PATMI|nr:alpha-N-acetylgalactosaminidase-like [Patiria miniata]
MKSLIAASLLLLGVTASVEASHNGLALTPPLGWNSWERFRCNLECDVDPENCISERLYAEMAKVIATEGYKEAGYEYVCMDDCWMSTARDAQGRLQPDPKRFPSGLKNLANYVHSLGLKLGIYQSMGLHSCEKYPGIAGHIDIDVQTYAEWGIDLVKMDTCYNLGKEKMIEGFINMSYALNHSGRPILFSCEWARAYGGPNFTEIAEYCNSFRNIGDIQDTWDRVLSIIDWFAENQAVLYKATGPGGFNDGDFIIAGDFSLSTTQAQSQFAMWTMMNSQIFLSSDLRTLDPEAKAIVLNPEILAVSQDKLGKMGQRIHKESSFEIWTKELVGDAYAVVFFSRATDMPHNRTTTMKTLGFPDASGYSVRDLFARKDLGFFEPEKILSVIVDPSGVVVIKATPKTRVKKGFHGNNNKSVIKN